jgi:hypothetical protein
VETLDLEVAEVPEELRQLFTGGVDHRSATPEQKLFVGNYIRSMVCDQSLPDDLRDAAGRAWCDLYL